MVVLEESLLSTRTLAKTGFPHLERLRNMTYAYGMACIEIVWRKELGNLLHGGASKIIDSLGVHLEAERERRRKFREDILGLLPYDVEALHNKGEEGELGPSVDLSVDSGDLDLEECDFSLLTVTGESLWSAYQERGTDSVIAVYHRLRSDILEFLLNLQGDAALIPHANSSTTPLSDSIAKLKLQVETMALSLARIRDVWELQSESV